MISRERKREREKRTIAFPLRETFGNLFADEGEREKRRDGKKIGKRNSGIYEGESGGRRGRRKKRTG